MVSAVLYSSCTGSCRRYAQAAAEALHIPAYEAGSCPALRGREVIYVGWVLAEKIVGYPAAAKKAAMAAVVRVGMGPVTPGMAERCRQKNGIPADVPVFCLQGAFDLARLPLPFRLIMKVKVKDIAARLNKKAEAGALSAQEQATLRMAADGKGEPASWDGIQEVIGLFKK